MAKRARGDTAAEGSYEVSIEEGAANGGKDKASTSPRVTADSDWQKDSLLLMAHHVRASLTPAGQAPGETEQTLGDLVSGFIDAAELYYVTGVDELLRSEGGTPEFMPFEGGLRGATQSHQGGRREIMARISGEWARLMSIISTALLLDSATPAARLLRAVFRCARNDLRLRAGRAGAPDFIALPHFGRHFELVSFAYARDIFLVGIPVGELYNPWRYGLIWHEMAGIYVRQHRDEPEGVIQRLLDLLRHLSREGAVWEAWQRELGAELQGLPLDEGGYLADVVLRNWAEELVEDAAGVLCLGEAMLISLRSALEAAYAPAPEAAAQEAPGEADPRRVARPRFVDLRHPPARLRIALASHMLAQRDRRAVAEALPGVDRLAAAIAGAAELIVPEPLRADEEAAIKKSLKNVARGSTAALDKALGLRLAKGGPDLGDQRAVRFMVAAATRAFHDQRASGDRIRALLFNGAIRVAPRSRARPDTRSELFQALHRSGFSQSDELYTTDVSCNGSTATFNVGGSCGVWGHSSMLGWGQAWHD